MESEGGWTEVDGVADGGTMGQRLCCGGGTSCAVLPPHHGCPLSPCRGCHPDRAGDTGHGELRFSEDRHLVWAPDSRSQQGWWLQLGRAGLLSGIGFLPGSLAGLGRREMGARLPLLQSGYRRFSLRG